MELKDQSKSSEFCKVGGALSQILNHPVDEFVSLVLFYDASIEL